SVIASLSLAWIGFAARNRTPACPARSRQRQWTAMTRRRLLCGLLLLLVVLASGVGVFWIANPHEVTVTRARLEQVRNGMLRDEVILIVGGPPGDYARRRLFVPLSGSEYPAHEEWLCDDGQLLVRFDDTDRAIDVVRTTIKLPPPLTLTERIRRWLGL